MHNAMAYALIRTGYAKVTDKRGMFRDGWNARLSYKTHRALTDAGFEKFSSH